MILAATLQERLYRAFIYDDRYKLYFQGLGNTLLIAFLATLIGVAIGVVLAMINYVSKKTGKLKVLSAISKTYIMIIRGTPVVLQLFIMYFVVLASSNNGIAIGALTFGLNSGAYVAETIRSGIMAIDIGQNEAGRSIGFSNLQTMWYIILPQAFKNILPAVGNEMIALLKETSVAGYVAVMDLTKAGNQIKNTTYDQVNPILLVAIVYLIIVIVMTKLLGIMERRLRKSEH